MAGVTFRDVRKVYAGGVEAVRGVSFDVADGAFCVLVGPSGCGKSTLLRMVAGVETISAGEIRIGERVVNDIEPSDRDIAMVFQNYALYPHMSVYNNMAYGLRNRRVPKPEIDRLVRDAAKILEIENFLDRKPRALSGGQRQRVAMGRAIVRQPKAFLFDEPLSNLDAKLRGQMRIEIKRLQRSLATTSVYVTHDQLEAMTLADRLVVMNAGRIEQVGKPLALYERPATLFVAGFIGSPPMNLINVDYLRDKGSLTLPESTDLVGIRPDTIQLAPPEGPHIVLRATVELYEPIGGESHLHMRLEGSGQLIVAAVPARTAVTEGAQATLYVSMADLHPFNQDTGRRID